jgi:hypothetical protein
VDRGGLEPPTSPSLDFTLPRGWTVLDPYPTRLDYRPDSGGANRAFLNTFDDFELIINA